MKVAGKNMLTLLQIDFPHQGPWGEEMATAMNGLALDIAAEAGLIWKIWTESSSEGLGGGIYLFADEVSARDYLGRHQARLEAFGYSDIRARVFAVNQPMSQITKAPF